MVRTIIKLYDRLKDEYSDRLELMEVDEEVLLATLDGKPFKIDYVNDKYLKLMVSPENEIILELLKHSLRKLANNYPGYYRYNYYADGSKTANLEWDFVNIYSNSDRYANDDSVKGKGYIKK